MKALYISIGIIILVSLFFISSTEVNKRTKRDYKMFNKSDLKGVFIKGTDGGGIKRFYLKNDKTEYRFSPYTSELNRFKIFSHTTVQGDSILKPAFSDTLVLIHGGRILKYTFKKY